MDSCPSCCCLTNSSMLPIFFFFFTEMCPKPNNTGSALSKKSHVEDFTEPYPSLFEALTAEPDTQKRWITVTFPVDFDLLSYQPKLGDYYVRKSQNFSFLF